jgi:hypothetical protein
LEYQWTQEIEDRCKNLLENRYYYYEVADITNIAYEEIIKRDISKWRIRMNNKPYKWTEEDKSIAQQMLKEGYHCIDIARKIKIPPDSINGYNQRYWHIPLLKNNRFGHWEQLKTPEIEKKVCRLFELGLKQGLINAELNYIFSTEKSIADILRKYGYNTNIARDKYSLLDEHYFDFIDSEEKAYFLGLLITDGWITKPKDKNNYDIGLSLESQDRYMIEKFQSVIHTDRKIVDREKIQERTGYVSKQSQLILSSNVLANKLKEYGVVENKSDKMRIIPNNIPISLMHHFMRGMIDGNGSLYIGTGDNLIIRMIGTKDIVEFINI